MLVPTVYRAVATKIAEGIIAQFSNDELEHRLFSEQTIEREFGWVFFYGPRDPLVQLAGKAPFIVDSRDGSVHVIAATIPRTYFAPHSFRSATALLQTRVALL